jgi:NADH-quinone oxidoreductase subunit B
VDKADHLEKDQPSEFPVPAFGAHDLEPPSNPGVFHPPLVERA